MTDAAQRRPAVRGWLCRLMLVALLALPTLAGAQPAGAIETDRFVLQPHPLEVRGEARRSFAIDPEATGTLTDAFRVHNRSEEPLRLRVYATDAFEEQDGSVTVAPYEHEPRGVGTWIDVERSSITLFAKTGEIVDFTIHVPDDATTSGMGAIVAEELREPTEDESIAVVYRLALLVKVGGDTAGLTMSEPDLDVPISLIPGAAAATTELTNETLQPAGAEVQFTVESLTGYAWNLDPVDVRLEAGESLEVSQTWTTVPRWGGILRVTATADWEGGSVSTASPRRPYLPLWVLALLIVAVGYRAIRELRKSRRRGPTSGPDGGPQPVDPYAVGYAPTVAGASDERELTRVG